MIEVRGLCVGYPRRGDVLRDISLTLEQGQLVSVVGRNASGKSTLLRAMLGLLPRSRGEICIDGAPIGDMSRREVARKAAYLSQGRETPDMTVGELVLHGRFPHTEKLSPYGSLDREIARACIERMRLQELVHTHLSELSGGVRQRVYICMLLCQSTEHILLDEPTAYLDVAHQLELMHLLSELREDGKGIICVMHDIPQALEHSDMIAVIDDGRLVAFDTPRRVCEGDILESAIGVRVSFDGKRYFYDHK